VHKAFKPEVGVIPEQNLWGQGGRMIMYTTEGERVEIHRACLTLREYTSPEERALEHIKKGGIWGKRVDWGMHIAMKNAGGMGWEGEGRGMYIQEVAPKGDCLPLALIQAIMNKVGSEQEVRALRKQVRNKMIKDTSIRGMWEESYRAVWKSEAKRMGGIEREMDEASMEREWLEVIDQATGVAASGGPAFLSPIHIKTLAMIIGRHIIVVAAADSRFPTETSPGQVGGIYRAQGIGEEGRDKKMRAVVLGYANSHFGTIVKWPGAHRACSIQIGKKGEWGMVQQFDYAQEANAKKFLYVVEDKEGGEWADMFMGEKEGTEWDTNKAKPQAKCDQPKIKMEQGDREEGVGQ
jgi:hypothetical protein